MFFRSICRLTRQSRSGSALIFALLVSAFVLLAVTGSFRTTTQQVMLADRSHRYLQALGVAEAGVERAMSHINAEDNITGDLATENIGGTGEFRSNLSATAEGWVIDSTGYVPKRNAANEYDPSVMRRRLRVTVRGNFSPSLFKWTLFGYQSMNVNNAFTLSSWDLKDGGIPSAVNKHHTFGTIGSLGDIYVANGSKIQGSIQAGGDLSGMKKPVSGSNPEGQPNTAVGDSPPEPPGDFPNEKFDAAKTNNNNATGFTCSDLTYQPYNPSTKVLTVSKGNVTVKPGVYYLAGIRVTSNNATVSIVPAGRVTVYLDGDLELNNHAQVNTDGPSKNLQVFQKSGNIKLDNGCTVHAAILSHENSVVTFANTVDYFGSLIGGTINIGNAKMFVYDEELTKISGPNITGGTVASWVEVQPREKDGN